MITESHNNEIASGHNAMLVNCIKLALKQLEAYRNECTSKIPDILDKDIGAYKEMLLYENPAHAISTYFETKRNSTGFKHNHQYWAKAKTKL